MLMPSAKTAAEAKRDLLLKEAAEEFNARGISGASVARIAGRVGLTRAAVYYYVKDREDLAAQCYREACARMAGDLAQAARVRESGLQRLLAFIRIALDPERPPAAAISERDALEAKARREIAVAHEANIANLRALVRDGIADGSIRACDDEIVAQTLIGTVTWIPLSVDWVEGTDPSYRVRTVEALCDLLTSGQAADRSVPFVSPVQIESFFLPPSNAFDREAAAAAKVEQLLMTASQMFNRRGIDGTSLDDITAALGATKGALYHYFRSKPDLVVRCYKRAFALYERFTDAAEVYGQNGLERGMIGLHLNVGAHASGLSPLIQMVGSVALPPAARREITRRARAIQRRFEAFGQQGVKDGSLRPMDFYATAQLGAGAFQWLPKWLPPDDPRSTGALASEIVDLFIRGLRAENR